MLSNYHPGHASACETLKDESTRFYVEKSTPLAMDGMISDPDDSI